MNYKNLLQEYIQKTGFSTIIYDGKMFSSGWIGSVKINFDKSYLIFYGIICKRKKDSQQDASKKALEYLNNYKLVNKYITYKDINILHDQDIVFIDIENISKYDYIIPSKYIYGFISTNSHLYNKIDDIKRYMNLYIYNGKEKDGSDILLTMTVSEHVPHIRKYKNKVIIVTNDHFGKCIKKILKINNIYCDVVKILN